MSAGPRGPVNGEESAGPLAVRRRELAAAIDKALPPPAEKAPDLPWPRVARFFAREQPKLHSSLPSTYEVMWAVRHGPIAGEATGAGFAFTVGMPARNLAVALRTIADRLDEVALAVEEGREVPAFEVALPESAGRVVEGQAVPVQPVDKPETGVSSHGPAGQAVRADNPANDPAVAPEGQAVPSEGGNEPGPQS